MNRYTKVVAHTRRHGPLATGDNLGTAALPLELVRYATLAPSSHNTQCWRFRLDEKAITLLPDLSRRCPAVGPDDHHLFVSLGCALENLIQAALAHGLQAHPEFDTTGLHGVRVALEATTPIASPLFQAIPERQCTRGLYEGQPVSRNDLHLLEKAGTGRGVRVMLLS